MEDEPQVISRYYYDAEIGHIMDDYVSEIKEIIADLEKKLLAGPIEKDTLRHIRGLLMDALSSLGKCYNALKGDW